MRREKGGGAHSPSENNHDLEPIGQALFAGYFLSIPAIPVDDRCPIGQHLNRVKIKMVNAEGSAVTRAGVGEMSVSELRNGEWRMAKAKTSERQGK
jgi:hypothetical protein